MSRKTKRKAEEKISGKWIAIVALVVFVIVMVLGVGGMMIDDSEAYALGRRAVAAKLDIEERLIHRKWYTPFKFSDGAVSGYAKFVLCAPDATCFTVVARKSEGRWVVENLVKL
ncbi:hypothetical protein BH11PSE11_BH11PSE11_34490 [soil metagenome]